MKSYILTNVVILAEKHKIFGESIVVDEGRIAAVAEIVPAECRGFPLIDGHGLYAGPGFVEAHFHGCGSRGLEDQGASPLACAAGFLAARGINTFVPTLMCDEALVARLAAELDASPSLRGAVPGLYLEGPFINGEKRGGIHASFIRTPDAEYLKRLVDLSRGFLKMMTIAPELPGAPELIDLMYGYGIVPCYGHSNCAIGDLPKRDSSRKLSITHLFNAMSGISHKEAGLAMLPFLDDSIYFELNADTIHVNEEALILCARHCEMKRMVLVSDAVVSAGLRPGTYSYYGKSVISGDRGVRYVEGDVLVGSSCLIPEGLRRFLAVTGMPLEIAIDTATLNPQDLLGRSVDRGSIAVGKVADIVLFDDTFTVRRNLWA